MSTRTISIGLFHPSLISTMLSWRQFCPWNCTAPSLVIARDCHHIGWVGLLFQKHRAEKCLLIHFHPHLEGDGQIAHRLSYL